MSEIIKLTRQCLLTKISHDVDSHITVTEWANNQGVSIDIETENTKSVIDIYYEEFETINKLVNILRNDRHRKNSNKSTDRNA